MEWNARQQKDNIKDVIGQDMEERQDYQPIEMSKLLWNKNTEVSHFYNLFVLVFDINNFVFEVSIF